MGTVQTRLAQAALVEFKTTPQPGPLTATAERDQGPERPVSQVESQPAAPGTTSLSGSGPVRETGRRKHSSPHLDLRESQFPHLQTGPPSICVRPAKHRVP